MSTTATCACSVVWAAVGTYCPVPTAMRVMRTVRPMLLASIAAWRPALVMISSGTRYLPTA